jgi:putative mRNA 3-end processing factor
MLIMTAKGLYCPRGNFYIDPKGAVEHAVITHAHSDHARKGSKHYYCVASGAALLKVRLGDSISVKTIPYRDKYNFGDVVISFHPAGHILGSSQVRIELNGEVWVVSGDYKRDNDPTCEPFETVECDVFITEATFGTPGYCWNKEINFGEDIFNWWNKNSLQGFNSVLFAYSLGKAQRILGHLHSYTEKPIFCHPATEALNICYREQGINLAPTINIDQLKLDSKMQGGLFLVPQSFLKSEQASLLGNNYKTAFASGWMAKDTFRYDAGFVMSDHADWNDLLRTVLESKAKQVYVQHRGNGALVKELKSLGIHAYSDADLFPTQPQQLTLL